LACISPKTRDRAPTNFEAVAKYRLFFLDRPQTENPSVQLNELMAELLQVPKLRDLALGLAQGGGVGERFGCRFAIELVSEPQIGTVDGLADEHNPPRVYHPHGLAPQ
jgi:hypothetical protein